LLVHIVTDKFIQMAITVNVNLMLLFVAFVKKYNVESVPNN